MSRKYNVYGIGNALVDMEFTVSPDQLQELGIDKGVMTLVDETRENDLITLLKPHLCKQSGGGSAANTMVALSQFGGKGFYSCRVAQDDAGIFYLQDLQACGLDTNPHNEKNQDEITGKCLVLITPDADRTMNTFLGITGSLSEQELVPSALQDSDYLYIEGYLVTSASAKACVVKAKAIAESAGVKTSLSLSDPNMANFFKDGLLEMIGNGVDLLFANETEAMTLAGTDDFTQAITYCKTLARSFAITRGAQGSVIFDGEKLLDIPTTAVQAIDTVGAGDMYAGGLLYGITQGLDYAQAGKLASRAAAKIVTCYGARLENQVLQDLVKAIA